MPWTRSGAASAEAILEERLPAALKARRSKSFLDSRSEQFARRVTTKAATENADETVCDSSQDYSRVRQAQIMSELAEFIENAPALEQRVSGENYVRELMAEF